MLQNGTGEDAVPKEVVVQMLGTLAGSIISMCAATRNISTFVRNSTYRRVFRLVMYAALARLPVHRLLLPKQPRLRA